MMARRQDCRPVPGPSVVRHQGKGTVLANCL
jgi:hypothetical protein